MTRATTEATATIPLHADGPVEVWAVSREPGKPVLVVVPPVILPSVELAEAAARVWPAGRYECCTAEGRCLAVLLVGPDGRVLRRDPEPEDAGDIDDAA